MAQITREFDEPYVSGQGTTPLPSSFSPSVIGIAGTPYLLDTVSGRYQRASFDVVQQRNTNDPRDVLLLPQDVWRQQAESWHMGMGQSNQDRNNSLPYRYEESFGIDPWTQWQLSLLKDTAQLPATQTLTGTTWLTTVSDWLVVVNGEMTYWYDSLSASATPVGSVTISSGNDITDIANDGYIFMGLTEDKYIWTLDSPTGTPAKWANHAYTDPSFIAWEKDYLLAGDENKLYNALKGNNPSLIFTHPDPDFRWYSAASGQSCIYVLGKLGDRTYIHRVNIKQDGTGLQPCIVAATLPDGEVGYTVESYLNFILIGTNKGVRIAQASNDAGDLVLGPVIPTPNPVYCFEGQDRFIWYGNSGMNSEYGGAGVAAQANLFPSTCSGLGRMDLSTTTTSQLTPAYANDLAVTSIGSATVRSVRTFLDKRVFSIDGNGVWYETDAFVDGGWLTQGTMSFSVEDLKTALYMQGKWLPLTGKIAMDISYDSADFARVAMFQIQGSVRSENAPLYGEQFSRMDARYLLLRDTNDDESTPYMTRWEVRAIPVKGRNQRWTLPILNYEDTEIDMVKYTRDPLAVLNTLVGLAQSGQIFTLQESGQSYSVHVKEFVWQPEKLTMSGKAWQGIFTMVVEEVA